MRIIVLSSDVCSSDLQYDEAAVAAGCLFDPAETLRRIAVFRGLTPAPQKARSADWDPDRDLTRDDGFYQLSMRGDYELTDDIVLTLITALSTYKVNYSVEPDGTTLKGAGDTVDGRVESFILEKRL